jgi:hypothetical protein
VSGRRAFAREHAALPVCDGPDRLCVRSAAFARLRDRDNADDTGNPDEPGYLDPAYAAASRVMSRNAKRVVDKAGLGRI